MTDHQVHIFLVEDDRDHVELLRRAFQSQSKRMYLTVVGNLLEAQAYLANHTPDLVIADLHIPGGKGTDLLEGPGKVGKYPIIIMTSQGDEQMAVDAIKAGALDYIVKTEMVLDDMPRLADRALREWKTILMRREAEEAVKTSEAKYQDLYDHAPDMFLSVDLQTEIILECNHTLVLGTGYTKEEIVGRPITNFFHSDCVDEVRKTLHTILEVGEVRDSELQVMRKDGSVIEVSFNGSAVRDNEGRILFARSICRDITDRKQAKRVLSQTQEALRQAQELEAIGTLAGGIAHDFNNILSAMLGFAEMAITTMPTDSREWLYLEQVLKGGNRAKELVKQILAFSRKAQPHRELLPLNLMVKEVLRLMIATLPTNIEIVQNFDNTPETILADPTQIHRVLVNLLINAEQAMGARGGRLEVGLEVVKVTEELASQHTALKPGRHVRLMITDTGCGMSPKVLDRIFEPFFTTKPQGEGTGLGLSVIHGIITNHNGAITVKSVPDQGTTFSVYLPQIEMYPSVIARDRESIPLQSGRILLVEDEKMLARLGQEMLEQLGYEVVVQTSSISACEVFRAEPYSYDVVITDQTMPNLTGDLLASELLKIRPDVPIILYTGFSHTMSPEKAKALGIREYLEKPLLKHDLAMALARVRNIPFPLEA